MGTIGILILITLICPIFSTTAHTPISLSKTWHDSYDMHRLLNKSPLDLFYCALIGSNCTVSREKLQTLLSECYSQDLTFSDISLIAVSSVAASHKVDDYKMRHPFYHRISARYSHFLEQKKRSDILYDALVRNAQINPPAGR